MQQEKVSIYLVIKSTRKKLFHRRHKLVQQFQVVLLKGMIGNCSRCQGKNFLQLF